MRTLLVLFLAFCTHTAAFASLPALQSYTPGQYTIRMAATGIRSELFIALPLAVIEKKMVAGIKDGEGTNPDFTYTLNRAAFVNQSLNSPVMNLIISIEGWVPAVGMRFTCDVDFQFAVARSSLSQLRTQVIAIRPACSTGGVVANWVGLMKHLDDFIRANVQTSVNRALFDVKDPDGPLYDFIKNDGELYNFIEDADVQLQYCAIRTPMDLCLVMTWRPRWMMDSRFSRLSSDAPVPLGPVDKTLMPAKIEEYRALGKKKDSAQIPGYSYPAKFEVDTGIYALEDLALFGGLLCLSGETQGCELVSRSQGPTGRFWRAPDLVDVDMPTESTFSGDQFKGVVAYFLRAGTADQFERFLRYVISQRVPVPDAQTAVDYAYKFCEKDFNNTCMLAGNEWHWLNFLARKFGKEALIPAEVRDPLAAFGFTYDLFPWQASLLPAGYRMHLIGIELLLAKEAGIQNSSLDLAAQILSSRQPKNPFFAYLNLGADQRVADEVGTKCSSDPQRKKFIEWSWEGAEKKELWKSSMAWECVFMYRMLGR